MDLTLLLDLDNTLLDNSMETFLPAYIQALGEHLSDLAAPEDMARWLMTGTQFMFANQRPDQTLEQVFEPHFYPHFDLDRAALSARVDRFYNQVFPSLRRTTRPRQAAHRLMKTAVQRGYTIAIATNPLFPRTAIVQRMEWAGLSAEDDHIALVPSMETFHFAKPNPAYLAELLSYLGWPEGPVLMVGDDPALDMACAAGLGIPSFWVRPEGTSYPEDAPPPTGEGTLDDLIPWLDRQPVEHLTPDFQSPAAILATLRGCPAALQTLTRDLPPAHWQRPPQEGEWCLTEILCHLRDVERELTLPRLKAILNEETPFIVGVDSDAWAEERNYRAQDGKTALQDYLLARLETLEILAALTPEQWQRTAQHAIFGPTSLQEMMGFSARHDRMHVQQALQTIKKQ
ncbi:MAG: hypothetical protein D6803_01910 [Anaerolineae bacterium]|nr:MAG: hypothetical protein D6803_01910 [Anaerolineae bacterium]